MQTRRLWRRAAALAGGIAVGFVFVSALRQTPYDAPTTLTRLYHYDGPSGCEGATSQEDCQLRRRLQESDREKAIRLEQQIGSGRPDGTGEGKRDLRCRAARSLLVVCCRCVGYEPDSRSATDVR